MHLRPQLISRIIRPNQKQKPAGTWIFLKSAPKLGVNVESIAGLSFQPRRRRELKPNSINSHPEFGRTWGAGGYGPGSMTSWSVDWSFLTSPSSPLRSNSLLTTPYSVHICTYRLVTSYLAWERWFAGSHVVGRRAQEIEPLPSLSPQRPPDSTVLARAGLTIQEPSQKANP